MVEVEAFAPGHITGIFSPHLEEVDPLARGSTGAGLVLDLGARARVSVEPVAPGKGELRLTSGGKVVGLPITERALRVLLSPGHHRVIVEVSHDLPTSQGFGMSAAGTLAAALGVAKALGLPTHDAVAAAHRAELDLHGGLGGIPAILGGGLEVRRRAGLPPLGRVERTEGREGIFVASLPETLPSPPLLREPDFLRRVSRAAERLLDELPPPPVPLLSLLRASEQFTDALGLAPPRLRALIEGCRESGCPTAQAMLGNTIFSLPGDVDQEERLLSVLRRHRVAARLVHMGESGARVLPPPETR